MKNILFSTLLLISTLSMAQTNTFPSSGNVGIGTTSPTSKLQVSGGSNNWGQTIPGLSTGSIHLDPENSSDHFGSAITFGASDTSNGENAQAGIYVRSDGSYGTKMYFATTDAYVLGSKTAMIIDQKGNVGIGTTTPDLGLDITGGDTWQMKLSNASETKRMLVGWYESRNTMEISTWGDGVYESVPLNFRPKTVSFNGNVGVGTKTPDSKLTVKGKIHAEEVKVDLSVPAPDYVFTKDYKLLTIEEVQQHIKENGHLPNVPSATEMETNGVELGLMNMKLLEKIEELTLYTINQEKKLQEQQKINKDLETRLTKIETVLMNNK
ncbi:tail fiber protein [Aquimarina algiphila]|uniref:Peptidase S74 domain-containing protein n=1 Tax=Aquimarina algiphila TaxID=2047982 RepID=A0A554VH05_9FLAO|nr:tail fiber protein [Aquimarina algiphila]TSE06702.1 hypothetical protein FOF46_18525 [Aquimarina algiphila]